MILCGIWQCTPMKKKLFCANTKIKNLSQLRGSPHVCILSISLGISNAHMVFYRKLTARYLTQWIINGRLCNYYSRRVPGNEWPFSYDILHRDGCLLSWTLRPAEFGTEQQQGTNPIYPVQFMPKWYDKCKYRYKTCLILSIDKSFTLLQWKASTNFTSTHPLYNHHNPPSDLSSRKSIPSKRHYPPSRHLLSHRQPSIKIDPSLARPIYPRIYIISSREL